MMQIFGGVWNKYVLKQPLDDYLVQNGYLFKGSGLCIPRSSLRDKLLRKLHSSDLSGHVGREKNVITSLSLKEMLESLCRGIQYVKSSKGNHRIQVYICL
jgi:hypothetical protein